MQPLHSAHRAPDTLGNLGAGACHIPAPTPQHADALHPPLLCQQAQAVCPGRQDGEGRVAALPACSSNQTVHERGVAALFPHPSEEWGKEAGESRAPFHLSCFLKNTFFSKPDPGTKTLTRNEEGTGVGILVQRYGNYIGSCVDTHTVNKI